MIDFYMAQVHSLQVSTYRNRVLTQPNQSNLVIDKMPNLVEQFQLLLDRFIGAVDLLVISVLYKLWAMKRVKIWWKN